MSLQFESLTLKNFGPYREIENLRLQTTAEAPIVVIHGENTLGKTSLFRALRWCLYGAPLAGKTASESARGLNDYMNRPARVDGESEMQVAIRFTADGHQFNLTRTARFEGGAAPKVTADLRIDSQVVQQSAIDMEIGRQLHPQISDFFLFDGELLRDFYDRLNSDRERDLLKSSIESVLGIPALQMAARDIGAMTTDALQRQTKAMKNKRDADSTRQRLLELKSRQESLDKDRSEIKAALRKARADLKRINDQIASVDELKADARESEMLEAQISGAEDDYQDLSEEMRKLLSDGWLAPASAKLSQALAKVVEKNNAAQEKQNEVQQIRARVDLLQKKIQGGTCPTCNQKLPSPDAATQQDYADAKGALQQLIGEAGAGPNLARERRIRSLIDDTTIKTYQEKQEQANKIATQQYERKRRLGRIKDRFKDNDVARIRQLGNDQDRLERGIAKYEERLKRFDNDQAKIISDQNKLANALRRLGTAQPDLAAETFFFEYVNELIDRTIGRYQERTRAEVEQAATEMFSRLIRDPEGYDGIRIGSDYRLDLVGKRGPTMKTSEGGRQLIALSLIGALKQAAVRGGPVVLDSPLARLDLEHRENVLLRWVPELGTQAILLVQSGELTEEQARDIMGSRVGHAYRIIRPGNDPEEAIIERTR